MDQTQNQQISQVASLQRLSGSPPSVADSAGSFYQNETTGIGMRIRSAWNSLRHGSTRRESNAPSAPVPAQMQQQQMWSRAPNAVGRSSVHPTSFLGLLRVEVAEKLSTLPAEKRSPLLDLLKENDQFAVLFAYRPGPTADSSAFLARNTQTTEEHKCILAKCMDLVQNSMEHVIDVQDSAPEPSHSAQPDVPTATPPPVDSIANPAAITMDCVPEFTTYKVDADPQSRVRVVLSLKATSKVMKQSNVAVTCVLDVSGSMAGNRIELLKETSHFLITQVTSEDYLGFVSYSSNAFTDVPLMRMTPNAKLFTHTIVESLNACGSTALYDGTMKGMKQQLEAMPSDATLAKAVFLCTDGEANCGPSDADSILPGLLTQQTSGGQPCTIHTFGIGDGHSASLLQAISEAMSGMYFYLRSTDDVAPAYGEALGGLKSVIAKNVRVSLPATDGHAQLLSIEAGGVMQGNAVIFNDLYAEETRELLITFALPQAVESTAQQQLSKVLVEYVDPATGQQHQHTLPVTITRSAQATSTPPHPLVIATAARYETAVVIQHAQKLNEDGKREEATDMLKQYAASLSSLEGQVPAHTAKHLHMFCSQAQAVAQNMEQAGSLGQKASTAVTQAAWMGLRQQRAANTGMTACLPQGTMYDSQSKSAVRMQAQKSVQASMASKLQRQ